MKLRLLLLAFVCFSLTSCFDVIETFNINEDGSGVYEQKMDFSRGISFASMMGGGKSGKIPVIKDTVLNFSSIVDTIKEFTAEEKAVMRNASAKVHMDEDKGEMWLQIIYPFANTSEFITIQEAMKKEGSKSMMASLAPAFGQQIKPSDLEGQKQQQLPTSDFTYRLTPNSLSKTVKPGSMPDTAKPAGADLPPELKEMFQMSFTTFINLPRPAKKWDGNNGTLSADKKQLTFRKNIDLEAKLTPADFNFSVEY